MKKFSLILGLILLTGCKTSKTNCDAYGNAYFIRTDSMIVVVDHCHDEKNNYCYYNLDTIRLTK
jgi:hypothetical protein